MSPLHSVDYGLDADRVGALESPMAAIRRRLGGRYAIDPFGLDPQLSDLISPIVASAVRVEIEGGERLPRDRGAVLFANRGFGIGSEPTALAVAVRRETGRRLRVVGAPGWPYLGALFRRLGGISASPEDIGAALRAGHLVAVPLAPTWLPGQQAGAPPLDLVQAMLGHTVFPVAVTPDGPFGLPTVWRVHIGAHVALDGSYPAGDPLGAAELGEAVREAVQAMLAGEEAAPAELPTAGLAVPGA